MTISSLNDSGERHVVRIARIDSITLYEITESELSSLESGTPTGFLFDLFIALLTVALSFLVTITTTKIESERLFNVYVIVVVVCAIGSSICFCLWRKYRKTISATVKEIKERADLPKPSHSSDPTSKD